MKWVFAVIAMLFIGYGATASPIRKNNSAIPTADIVSFNEKFIAGLYTKAQLEEEDRIFDFIFSSLGDTATVYPTENYYYFSFNTAGKTIWGNLRLDVVDRDQGIIHLGYFEYDENGKYQDREGHEKAYSAKDGVSVKRLERFLYSVTHKNKTVLFSLNDIGMAPPRKAKLREDEDYVGPVFDESGLKFFLVFNKPARHFMYVLNEDGITPESFMEVGKHIVIGKRTGFAFYCDGVNDRKILIAVHGKNTDRNNYYDGPFDQLPDNYTEQTQIKTYIERAYPFLKGNVDEYGGFLNQGGARALINPYFVYYEEAELGIADYCKSMELPEHEFYSCLTPDPYQEEEKE
ncbi:MAG: hypothetical protein GY807_22975 [Gammaproteobacteria bacterium]|nr:hypothetical protein [Gammaproteobacteria bacterium]